MKHILSSSRIVIVLALVGIALSGEPARAQTGLTKFQAECAATSSGITCKGDQIGTATFTSTFFATSTPFKDIPNVTFCFLVAQDFTLTTPDGSTILFKTSGTQCNTDTDFRRQNSYLITGGTGRFLGVTGGAGSYVVSGLLPGTTASIHLDGNIQF
jgi:hypothetical protein